MTAGEQPAGTNNNESAHTHGPYEFFRSLLADRFEMDMDAMLERTITFLIEASRVPVRAALGCTGVCAVFVEWPMLPLPHSWLNAD